MHPLFITPVIVLGIILGLCLASFLLQKYKFGIIPNKDVPPEEMALRLERAAPMAAKHLRQKGASPEKIAAKYQRYLGPYTRAVLEAQGLGDETVSASLERFAREWQAALNGEDDTKES